MRNVEYITNGFGAPTQGMGGWTDFIAELRPTGSLGGALNTPAAKVSAFMVSTDADPTLRMVSVKTAEQRGLAGIEQTVNFFAAANDAYNAAIERFPNPMPPANTFSLTPRWMEWYKTSGERLYTDRLIKIMNSIINTASSRVGTNPLTSYFIQTLRTMISRATNYDQAKFAFLLYQEQRQLANQILRAARGY